MRTIPNRIVMWTYFAIHIVIPSLLFVWGMMQIKEGFLADPRLQKTVFMLLILWILPIYFVYSGIFVRSHFPRGLIGALQFFLPVIITLVLYAGSFNDWPSRMTAWMLTATPLFVGFMGLLLVGLVFLILRVNPFAAESIPKYIVSLLMVAAASLPVIYIFYTGLRLNMTMAPGGASMTTIVARYLICVGQVALFNIPLMKQLYLERAL